MKLKLLFFDLETAPTLGYLWRANQDYTSPAQTVHEFFILTWAARWADKKQILSDRLSTKEVLKQNDKVLVASLAELIREADVIVGHNMDRFDLPRVNSRLLLMGLEPLGPTVTIDTLKLCKANFNFVHNSLAWVAEQLGVGSKLKTDFELWEKCYHGNAKALKEMERYNRHDVELTEGVFNKIKPYVKRLRRLYDADFAEQVICPSCGTEGKTNFRLKKYYRTQAGTFPQFQCKVCQRYHRGRQSIKDKKISGFPL